MSECVCDFKAECDGDGTLHCRNEHGDCYCPCGCQEECHGCSACEYEDEVPCKQCQDKDAALAEERMYNTRQSAEISELKMKLDASEWIRRDNALRTYDGLTEKLAQAEERIRKYEEALGQVITMTEDCQGMSRHVASVLIEHCQRALSGKEE